MRLVIKIRFGKRGEEKVSLTGKRFLKNLSKFTSN